MNNIDMEQTTSRRTFLRTAAVGTAVAAVQWQIVPRHVLGRGFIPPSEKVNVAGIGCGGQGTWDLQQMAATQAVNIVGVCDPDPRRTGALTGAYPSAKPFADYRKMLDELKDVEGVVVATPDHHHAVASAEAIRRGKHVYCEKPLTHSVWEARELARLAREAKVATQMGNQGQATPETRALCETVWSGVIGPIREVHLWTDRPSKGLFGEYWPQGVSRPEAGAEVPAGLEWDLWLGPAPERAFDPAYHPFKWRGWWDFGTGALGDIGCHSMDPVFRALKLGQPTSVQGSSTRVNKQTYPLASTVTYRFPARSADVQATNVHVRTLSGRDAGAVEMPAVTLVWYDGGLRPPRPEGLPGDVVLGDNGRLLVGENGFILGSYPGEGPGDLVFPESLRGGVSQQPTKIPPSVGHQQEWIDACRGGPAAGSNFDWAGPLTEAVLLGNIALRPELRAALTKQQLTWDPAAMKFAELPAADAFLRRDYREGWKV